MSSPAAELYTCTMCKKQFRSYYEPALGYCERCWDDYLETRDKYYDPPERPRKDPAEDDLSDE